MKNSIINARVSICKSDGTEKICEICHNYMSSNIASYVFLSPKDSTIPDTFINIYCCNECVIKKRYKKVNIIRSVFKRIK